MDVLTRWRNSFTMYTYIKSLQCTLYRSYNIICQLYLSKGEKKLHRCVMHPSQKRCEPLIGMSIPKGTMFIN